MTDPTAGAPAPEGGSPDSPVIPELPQSSRPKRSRWKWILALVLLLPVLIVVLYTTIALSWAYSEGQRAGYLQKFSRKGWLCKTWGASWR